MSKLAEILYLEQSETTRLEKLLAIRTANLEEARTKITSQDQAIEEKNKLLTEHETKIANQIEILETLKINIAALTTLRDRLQQELWGAPHHHYIADIVVRPFHPIVQLAQFAVSILIGDCAYPGHLELLLIGFQNFVIKLNRPHWFASLGSAEARDTAFHLGSLRLQPYIHPILRLQVDRQLAVDRHPDRLIGQNVEDVQRS